MQAREIQTAESDRPPVPSQDRRRQVRHKIHTPAYLSLGSDSNGVALDLSEIINLSEDGVAIQTCSPLEAGSRQSVCLDLSETGERLNVTGEVVWCDDSGRAGIHFPDLTPESLYALKKWLFANAIAAWANHLEIEAANEPAANLAAEVPPTPDYTSILSGLAAVKKEVEALGPDLDAALHLIARRAHAFTRATGAAVALTEGSDMICRATAGADAPSLGARVKTGEGFSGECVRTGTLQRCDDSETDPRVDRETCRVLGIRSLAAVPVRWEQAVIGLLEVFAPDPNAFGADDEVVLVRLAEITSNAIHRAGAPEATAPAKSLIVDDEFPVETPADLPIPQLSRSRNLVLIAAAATVAFVIAWLFATSTDGSGSKATSVSSPGPSPTASAPKPSPIPGMAGSGTAGTLEGMRRLAEQGDPLAQFGMGVRYHSGEDVPQDYAEAFRWFSLAAEQGNVPAQATLGAYYWAGRGTPVDLNKAYFWSLLAETGGDEASKQRVALLASRLNRNQMLVAQQQADDWIRQHQDAARSSTAR
jgi:putative methionine-R-sulfoxide reductase with GAF domain